MGDVDGIVPSTSCRIGTDPLLRRLPGQTLAKMLLSQYLTYFDPFGYDRTRSSLLPYNTKATRRKADGFLLRFAVWTGLASPRSAGPFPPLVTMTRENKNASD
jgi:hypothetical protein